MAANPGLDRMIRQNLMSLLSDPANLPAKFIDYLSQYVAQNPVDVYALRAPVVLSTGTPGATKASRYVGATTSGAPVSGNYVVGDFVFAQNGHAFLCTVAGSPGTWVEIGGGGGGGSPRMVYGGFWGNDPSQIVNTGSGDWSLSGTPDNLTATITFDSSFTNPPVVNVTPGAGSDFPQVPMVNADTNGNEFTGHFTVSAFVPQAGGAGAFDDGDINACGFYFIAVGT